MADFGHFFKIDFIGRIAGAVVIGMGAIEVKNGRNALFGKIVVIRTVVITIGIFFIVVFIVQHQIGVC